MIASSTASGSSSFSPNGRAGWGASDVGGLALTPLAVWHRAGARSPLDADWEGRAMLHSQCARGLTDLERRLIGGQINYGAIDERRAEAERLAGSARSAAREARPAALRRGDLGEKVTAPVPRRFSSQIARSRLSFGARRPPAARASTAPKRRRGVPF